MGLHCVRADLSRHKRHDLGIPDERYYEADLDSGAVVRMIDVFYGLAILYYDLNELEPGSPHGAAGSLIEGRMDHDVLRKGMARGNHNLVDQTAFEDLWTRQECRVLAPLSHDFSGWRFSSSPRDGGGFDVVDANGRAVTQCSDAGSANAIAQVLNHRYPCCYLTLTPQR